MLWVSGKYIKIVRLGADVVGSSPAARQFFYIYILAMIPVLCTGCPPYTFFSLTSCTAEKCIFQLT